MRGGTTGQPADLEQAAAAAYLAGRPDWPQAWILAHRDCLRRGEPGQAARCAFWLGFGLLSAGEVARGGGWLARARKLVDEAGLTGAERGYLLVPEGIELLEAGDFGGALARFTEAGRLAERPGDPDLAALSLLGRSQALMELGDSARGLALLDESIVAVSAAEVSPIVAGLVYCGALTVCHEILDLRRAREWTAALSQWCRSQPDLALYQGQCLVHRAQVMQLQGDWQEAAAQARDACERLSGEPAAGDALYQRAELHRLRGQLADAEAAYLLASQAGREPQPGLALLRLAQGSTGAAQAAIRRVAAETTGSAARAQVLAACAEIMLAAGQVTQAGEAAAELAGLAAALDVAFVRALAGYATAAVLLAQGQPQAALPPLRTAWAAWRDIGAPYEAARARVLIGLACRAVGDRDTAALELDAARAVFSQLGAATELARLRQLAGRPARLPGGLSAREGEVLALLAGGSTNREISAALVISEHTVARHVQNIFAKLGVSSRTAATAFAFRHGLA
ncbi:MAG TPA: LuxR C-terminal-related transcriptional regulator [Streptosporangiaceae bacterium]|jgi:DNA-binding NarL/FixJ family response regulator